MNKKFAERVDQLRRCIDAERKNIEFLEQQTVTPANFLHVLSRIAESKGMIAAWLSEEMYLVLQPELGEPEQSTGQSYAYVVTAEIGIWADDRYTVILYCGTDKERATEIHTAFNHAELHNKELQTWLDGALQTTVDADNFTYRNLNK